MLRLEWLCKSMEGPCLFPTAPSVPPTDLGTSGLVLEDFFSLFLPGDPSIPLHLQGNDSWFSTLQRQGELMEILKQPLTHG